VKYARKSDPAASSDAPPAPKSAPKPALKPAVAKPAASPTKPKPTPKADDNPFANFG
jgi:hypothetical protein